MRNLDYEMAGMLSVNSHFEGEIAFDSIFRIDGFVQGRIVCKTDNPSLVIIGETAQVNADIFADTVIISGKFKGNIIAIEKVELYHPGYVESRIYTSDFVINKGAIFQGQSFIIKNFEHKKKKQLKFMHSIDFQNYQHNVQLLP